MLDRLEDRPLGLGERARLGGRRLGERAAEAATRKSWAAWSSPNAPASQAVQTTPPAAPEKPARCSRSPQEAQAASCGREAGGEQQLEAEGERVGAAGLGRVGVEQRELVGEQVVDAGVRVAVVEQPPDGVAGARGGVERPRRPRAAAGGRPASRRT